VLDPSALAGAGGARRTRALFLCGLQEGVFPAPARRQPFFGEEDRRRLATLAGLRLTASEDGLAGGGVLFYEAVSRPRELLALSWHAAGEEGEPAVRSLFVEDVCDLFCGLTPRAEDRRSEPGASSVGPHPGADGPPARTQEGPSRGPTGPHA